MVVSIFGVCLKYGILFEVYWILIEYNDCVDIYMYVVIGGFFYSNDWDVLNYIFIWGMYMIDDFFVNWKKLMR